MKVKRNYKFVLTVLDNAQLSAGEISIAEDAVTGEFMFSSECHYYAEKNIIEALKEAEKRDALSEYFGFTYCIYKENKAEKIVREYEKDGKKIVETEEIQGAAMLVEVITVDENGVTIR